MSSSNTPFKFFKNTWAIFAVLQDWILFILIIIVAFGMFAELVLRLLNLPLLALEDMVLYIVVWLYFFGVASVTRQKSHQKADIINVFFKNQKSRELVFCVVNIVSALLMFVLFKSSYDYLKWALMMGERSISLGISSAYSIMCLPIGFGLSVIYFFINAIENFRNFSDNYKIVEERQ